MCGALTTLSRLHKNQGFGAHSPADTKSWYYVFKPIFRLIEKTYPNFKLGMRFIFSLGPRELDYSWENFSASHRVPQGGTKVKKSDFRQIWPLRPRRIFTSLNSSHDFLSVIFGILGKFGIGIGHKKKTKIVWLKKFSINNFSKKFEIFKISKIFKNLKNFRNFQKSQNSKIFQNVKMLSFQKKSRFSKFSKFWKFWTFFSPRWKNIFHPNFFKRSGLCL